MFTHVHDLQFEAKPDGPDPAFARRLQEVLGGQWGEMTVATQYLLQGWNCRLPGKYKDMLLDIGTEELAHVEMLVTMIARLQDGPVPMSRDAVKSDTLAAEYAGGNPQHQIVCGGGAYYRDANGVPWSGAYVTASGNLMADFHYNATAEMQGRLQVARLFHMTDDPGVKDLLRFLTTRDHMHQMQWLAAVEELKADGLDGIPVPDAFDLDEQIAGFDRLFVKASDGPASLEGSWASGPAPDGRGDFSSATIQPGGDRPTLPPGDPRLYGTPPQPLDPETLVGKIKDTLT
jgi:Mn-containing catalase